MKRFSRMFANVILSFAVIVVIPFAAPSSAQQAEPSKTAAAKKPAANASPEKAAENASKPEAPPEPRPAPRESSGEIGRAHV
jgi:hypothetical protein